ncbi:UvrD-helicase domain-containing protein [Mucilaginibacter segetis]|uniref:DNA 3'-5' helicase n=1 Tax=Mucilaginibacter segetis TaxID=2793071 RepID=A0A934PTX3_9SPHI|nr:ATP-dependent helicase [Mucilaginibacter segetis]MBK0379335.1 ATP-dependent helicase [Mucilaginibacter segetis]
MLEGLTDQQRAAVVADHHVLLTACPGSGKTRVLTHKVAYELQRLTGKKMVVALTFTNRASDEIKRRLDRMDIDATKLWTGTIHAFCLEWILTPYLGYLPELKNGFVIADEYKTEELLSTLRAAYDFTWDNITTRLKPDGSFAEQVSKYHHFLREYHATLKEQGLIDFDQLLYYAYKLIASYPKIARTLNNFFQVICVDEYQDTQELQYEILAKIITAKLDNTTLFMVGDQDQAIYGSLGGVARSLSDIKASFGNIDINEMKLSGNYRSTQRVIDYYRHYQTAAIDIRSMCAYAGQQGQITFNETVDKDSLAEHIAEIISERITAGIAEKEICVLAPQWWLVIPMGRKLKQLLPDVNFDAIGLSPLIKSKENIWFKVARLFLVDPAPNMYFVRTRWANELVDSLQTMGIDIFDSEQRKAKKLLRVFNLIKSDHTVGLKYLEDCFIQLLAILEIDIESNANLKQHWTYFFVGTQRRLDDPQYNYATDIQSFRRLFRHNQGVVVNTCHGIKGEEFHTVIAFGLLQGYIPNRNEADQVSAAKKLLYVICSRAKKELHLIAESGRMRSRNPMFATLQLASVRFDYDN